MKGQTTMTSETAQDIIRATYENSKCHAIVTFTGPGVSVPGFDLRGVDPVQLLHAIETIEEGRLKVQTDLQPIPQFDHVSGYIVLSNGGVSVGDNYTGGQLTRFGSVRLEAWRVRAALIVLKRFAEFQLDNWFMVQDAKQREQAARGRVALPSDFLRP
jgi:hypothetical protein